MFQGTLSAIVTPFKDSPPGTNTEQAVDFDALSSLVEWQVSAGVDGIVVCGSTGEAATLRADEKLAVIRRVADIVKGRVPLIAGTGTNATQPSVEMTKAVKAIPHIDGVLAVAPYYNKPSQEGLFRHFEVIAKEGGLPLVVYNIPGRSVVEIAPATLARLSKVPGIVAVKHAVDSISRLVEIADAIDGRIAILAGDDPIIHAVMSVGGKGVISASATVIPRMIKRITQAALEGKLEASFAAQKKALPYIQALFLETNPVPAKAALRIMNQISSDAVRLPLTPVTSPTLARLEELFTGLND